PAKMLGAAVNGVVPDVLVPAPNPLVAFFIEATASEIDINVHPAKAEVRFRQSGLVRGLIVVALRNALAAAGHRASSTVAAAAVVAFRPGDLHRHGGQAASSRFAFPPPSPSLALAERASEFLRPGEPAEVAPPMSEAPL